jgi:hypothetical protein
MKSSERIESLLNEWGPFPNSKFGSDDISFLLSEIRRKEEALRRLRDCDWTISLPDRMDAVREIARQALSDVEA